MIRLKFLGLGINNNLQSLVKIYHKNKKIYEGLTYNGEIYVNLKFNEVYEIEAIFFNEKISTYIYNNRCEYVFAFDHNILIERTITFLLKDYFYNLPIEKGELILWQNQ